MLRDLPARFSWPPPPTRALGGGRRGRGRWLGGGPLTVGEKDENAALLCSGTWKLWYSSGPYCGREQGSARPGPRAPRRRGLHARSRNENKTPRTQRALWVPAALPPTAPRRWSERTANTMPPSSSGAARAGPSSLAAHPFSQGIPESWPVVFVAAESPRERASREASTSPTGGHSGQIWLLRAHPARVCERGFLVRNERFASGPLLFCQWQKRGRVTRDACPPGSAPGTSEGRPRPPARPVRWLPESQSSWKPPHGPGLQ